MDRFCDFGRVRLQREVPRVEQTDCCIEHIAKAMRIGSGPAGQARSDERDPPARE
jgi:hypothetical protein